MLGYNKMYQNLLAQFERIYRHNRQGSIQTKHRYREAYLRFLVFLAGQFRLEKLANIAPKHIYAYVAQLKENGRAISYIKTELAAIRFFHDQIPAARNRQLPTNQQLELGQRQIGGVDRTWSHVEFNRALAIASMQGHEDYVAILCLARYAALRLHECYRIDTYTAQEAVKTTILTIKGKGGLVRKISINLSIKIQLGNMLERTPKGHKLFVQPGEKTHLAMKRMQNFLHYHRKQIQDSGSNRPLHFHGLRHTCALEWYQEFIADGMADKEALLEVSRHLGHGRASITNIYLAGLTEEEGQEEEETEGDLHDNEIV